MQEGHVTVDAVEELCVLVGVITSEIKEETAIEYLEELEFLAETAEEISPKVADGESKNLCRDREIARN